MLLSQFLRKLFLHCVRQPSSIFIMSYDVTDTLQYEHAIIFYCFYTAHRLNLLINLR